LEIFLLFTCQWYLGESWEKTGRAKNVKTKRGNTNIILVMSFL